MTDGMGKRDGPKGQDAPPSQTARLDTTTQNAYGAPRVEGASDLLRESEARFREFAEASSDVLWIRNAETLQWEYLSPAFEAVYGLSRERASQAEDNWLRWSELIVPEDRRYALNCMSRGRDGERISLECRIKPQPDGAERWLRSSVFPMTDQHGKVRRVGGIDRDISALKQAVDHRQQLHAELQHRVRNTLVVIRSIVRRTGESSETVEDFATHLDGRIDAFSRVQLAVTRNPLAGFDLAELISEELRACAAREGERYALRGPPVRLKAKAAEDIALAVHDLATNAVNMVPSRFSSAASMCGGRRRCVETKPGSCSNGRRAAWLATLSSKDGKGSARSCCGTR